MTLRLKIHTLSLFLIAMMMTRAYLPLAAEQLVEAGTTKIMFGKGANQVGLDKGGGEHWKPLFFSVDDRGLIHIPDFYKSRIAVFDAKGALSGSIEVKEGVSPRLNYFALTPSGRYVTFGDYTLYLIGKDGSLAWKKMLGYGAIPESIFANDIAIFLVLPGGDGRTIVFDYASNRPLGTFGFTDGTRGVPMVQSGSNDPAGKKGNFTFSLAQMRKIPESGFGKKAFVAKENASLVAIDGKNRSLWKKRHEDSENVYLFDSDGTLLHSGTIAYAESETEGNGFWTFTDGDMRIYKNYFYDDYMVIVAYEFD
jgi:hypothetical protein